MTAKFPKAAKLPKATPPGQREWGRPIAVEDTIEGKLQHWTDLPAAPYSIKPDLVVDDPMDPDGCLIVDHKSEGGSSDSTHAYARTSVGTLGQVILWNETRAARKGRARKHCNGLILNFINKRAKPNESPRTHIRADVPDWLALEFIQSRQWDALKFNQPASKNSSACRGMYRRGCPFYTLCFTEPGEARERELHYFKKVPWVDRPSPPSRFGASRYEVLNTCGEKHHKMYYEELIPLVRDEADTYSLDVGTGCHMLAAVNYSGVIRPDWLAAWCELPARAREEALRVMQNYANWYWEGELWRVVDSSDEEHIPGEGSGLRNHIGGPITD